MLDPARVKAARREEVDFVHEFSVYRKIPRASAVGGHFGTVKWIGDNRRDGQWSEHRSRLVDRELKIWDPRMSGTFAATQPLECLKMLTTS